MPLARRLDEAFILKPRTESSIVSSEDETTDVQLDISKYEGHLVDALVAVREGGVNCDFTKIRIEDALENMADLLAEVKRLRKELEWFKQAINITADHIPRRAHWDAYVAEMVEKGLWPDEPED